MIFPGPPRTGNLNEHLLPEGAPLNVLNGCAGRVCRRESFTPQLEHIRTQQPPSNGKGFMFYVVLYASKYRYACCVYGI